MGAASRLAGTPDTALPPAPDSPPRPLESQGAALARAALPLLAALTVVGGALRVYRTGAQGIWLDEGLSLWAARLPVAELWDWAARIDQHPPLYYTLLGLWFPPGPGDAATPRLLSALLSTLTIPLIYALGRRLAGTAVGLLAAALLAAAPFHVRFAQEARMYALLAFCATAALACLAALADARTTPRRRTAAWIGYVLSMTAALLTHNTAVLFVLAANLAVLALAWRERPARAAPAHRAGLAENLPIRVLGAALPPRKPQNRLSPLFSPALRERKGAGGYEGVAAAEGPALEMGEEARPDAPARDAGLGMTGGTEPALRAPALRPWLVAQAAVVALWGTLWLRPFIAQAAAVDREFWLPAPTWRTVVDALGNFLLAGLPRARMPWLDLIWPIYAGLIALGLIALRRRPGAAAFLLALFLTPIAGELLVSLRRPIFYDRTLIPATIPLHVLAAAGIAALRRRGLVLGAAVVLLAASGLALREYYVNYSREEWREAAAYVRASARPGDLILFNTAWGQFAFDFYLGDAAGLVAEHGLPADPFERGVLEPRMTADDLPRLRALIGGRERVWLVYSHDWYADPEGLIPAALSDALRPAAVRRFAGVEVRLYLAREDAEGG